MEVVLGKKQVTDEAISSFIIAIKCCNLEEIKRYLEEYDPIIVNRLENQTRQPSIFFAVPSIDAQHSFDIMKLLIDHGANPHFKDNYQQTVLFSVCREGNEKCLDLLLEQGLDLNQEDIYGQTPLYYLAKDNRLNIFHKFIENKVDINHQDHIAGQTPLFYAAREGNLEMCKLLIESGADVTITDSSSKMAMNMAKKHMKVQVYEYLLAEYQTLKEKRKSQGENMESSLSDKNNKKKKKDGDTKATKTYRLYRSDNFGNANEVTQQQLNQLFLQYPQLENMLRNPQQIDINQYEEIKAKDAWIKAAHRTLTICSKIKGAFHFQQPVDPAKYGIDDYFEVITQPMDLGTIRKKLLHNVYSNVSDFISDMNLVFDNCMKYNGSENIVTKCAIEIRTVFEEHMKQTGYMS